MNKGHRLNSHAVNALERTGGGIVKNDLQTANKGVRRLITDPMTKYHVMVCIPCLGVGWRQTTSLDRKKGKKV
jgi:hypothetical protein